jgi:hypothetical protein
MNLIDIAAILGSLTIALLLSIARIMARRKPPEATRGKVQEKIRENAREEIKEIEKAHRVIYDGNRDTIASRVLADLERIRRERDK